MERETDKGADYLLDKHISQLCNKERLLGLIDFVSLIKELKNYAGQISILELKLLKNILNKQGGILYTGSSKSLTMVWLTKWIRENVQD